MCLGLQKLRYCGFNLYVPPLQLSLLLLYNFRKSLKQVCEYVCVCTCSTSTQTWCSLCVLASVWHGGETLCAASLPTLLLLFSTTFTTIHPLLCSHALTGCHFLSPHVSFLPPFFFSIHNEHKPVILTWLTLYGSQQPGPAGKATKEGNNFSLHKETTDALK